MNLTIAAVVVALGLAAGCSEELEVPIRVPVPKPVPKPSPPVDGRWSMSLDLSSEEYPTMEMYISHRVTGAGWMELNRDATMTACFGARVIDSGSVSHYQSPDHQDHSSNSDDARVIGLHGRWIHDDDGRVTITFTGASWGSCTVATESYDPQLELHCAIGAAGTTVPATALVCEHDNGTLRVGVRLDSVPGADRGRSNPSGDTIVLGRDPGLVVTVTQDRRATVPTIEAHDGPVTLREADYRPRRTKP